MRTSTIICFLLFLGGVALFLLQMWFQPLNGETFTKIIITDGALLVVCFIWGFLVRENRESKKISGEKNSLD